MLAWYWSLQRSLVNVCGGRYHLVICLPRCHSNTIATSHWLNLWERCRLNQYKSRGDEALFVCIFYLRDHIFVLCLKKKNQRTSSSCFGEPVLVVHDQDLFVVNESVATDSSLLNTQTESVDSSFLLQSLPKLTYSTGLLVYGDGFSV